MYLSLSLLRRGQRPLLRSETMGLRSLTSLKSVDRDGVVVVESPAKARKIMEFLGRSFEVIASYGHIRDLPPKIGSVIPENDFEMVWEPLKDSEKHIRALEEIISSADKVYLATDPDREGEAISWHLAEELTHRGAIKPTTAVRRITFAEVTEKAVKAALNNPRTIDEQLVEAYMARRALDYLFGFNLSPILWRKLPGATSAGRVQSVALRLICERENEIESFKSRKYWTIHACLEHNGDSIYSTLMSVDGNPVPASGYESEEQAESVLKRIKNSSFRVKHISIDQTRRNPAPPYTTSSLQQDANKKLGIGSTKTMQLAQQLYEGGMITYMRTDSPIVGQDAVEEIREALRLTFGEQYIPAAPRMYKSRVKNAQEAHEAIRPTNPKLSPSALGAKGFDSAAIALYELIRNRTIASQAESSLSETISVNISSESGDIMLISSANRTIFPGFTIVWRTNENSDDEGSQPAENVFSTLQELQKDQLIGLESCESKPHSTKPPARYSEGSLVKKMEELGVGRPSTYAPTIKLLHARGYIKSVRRRLYPKPMGRILTAFLVRYLPEYINYTFTSEMESQLDNVASGEMDWKSILGSFWKKFEPETASLLKLDGKEVIDALNTDLMNYIFNQKVVNTIDGSLETGQECPSCGKSLSVKLSHKSGPFIGCSDYPTCSYVRSLPTAQDVSSPTSPDDIGPAYKSMNIAEKYGMRGSVRLLGEDPTTGKEVFVRQGPYGPYIQCGLDKDHDMKRVPLPKDSKPRSLTLRYALSMLSLPRVLGVHPETGLNIEVRNGKFGPFIIHGKQMRSVPKELNPVEMTLEEGFQLLKMADNRRKRGSTKNRDKEKTITCTDEDIPRARSAYQFFLRDNLSSSSKKGKEKMTEIGEKWRMLSPENRLVYERLAEQDLLRVKIQQAGILSPTLEAWEELSDEGKRSLYVRLVDLVRRPDALMQGQDSIRKPRTPYTLFMQDVSISIRKETEGTRRGSFMTEVARRWRELPDSKRKHYIDLATVEQEEYAKKLSSTRNVRDA